MFRDPRSNQIQALTLGASFNAYQHLFFFVAENEATEIQFKISKVEQGDSIKFYKVFK